MFCLCKLYTLVSFLLLTLRDSESSQKLSLYNQSGIHFLKQYGKFYGLFDSFFVANSSHCSVLYSTESRNDHINGTYRIRDLNNYADWEFISTSDQNKWIDHTIAYPRISYSKRGILYVPDWYLYLQSSETFIFTSCL